MTLKIFFIFSFVLCGGISWNYAFRSPDTLSFLFLSFFFKVFFRSTKGRKNKTTTKKVCAFSIWRQSWPRRCAADKVNPGRSHVCVCDPMPGAWLSVVGANVRVCVIALFACLVGCLVPFPQPLLNVVDDQAGMNIELSLCIA